MAKHILLHFRLEKKPDTLKNALVWSGINVNCYFVRLRKPPSQLPFTAEMLVTTQTEAAASPRSDSTLSAPHSTQNSPKPARYVPARNKFELIAKTTLAICSLIYLLSKVSKIFNFIFIHTYIDSFADYLCGL